MTDETSLGAMIRTWRDRTSPAGAGLSVGTARRAVGLRREELAELSGISVDYVVRLEQGRAVDPSVQVIAALARALQLTVPERDHLYRLAGLLPPAATEIFDHIPPGLRRLLDRLDVRAAAAVFAADWQLVWWNRGWAALLGDPASQPARVRNFALDTFPVGAEHRHLEQWPVRSSDPDAVARAVVADLRRATGRYPDSRRLRSLVARLSGNAAFAELWASGSVGAHEEDQKVVEHPVVGPITVDCDVLSEGRSDQKVVVLTAARDSEDETKLRLAMIAAAQQLTV